MDASARDVDLSLYQQGDTWLKPTLHFQTAYFVEHDAWAGRSEEILGARVDHWAEWSLEPGLEGNLDLDEHGSVYGRLSGVGAWTDVGLDAAGSNLTQRTPGSFLLENAYLGWRSGKLFPGLGDDAIDLSLGAQEYMVGNGFLWWDGGSDGGKRGAYWISPSDSFEMTGIARLATGPFAGELVWLTPDDAPDTHTQIIGVNGDYALGTRASLGLGYWYLYTSDDPRRDGLHVVDLRGWVAPLPGVEELVLSGEIVRESNGNQNDSWAGWVEAAYTHLACPWHPQLSYRFALFTGDGAGANENQAFDPLAYGQDTWGTWDQGELLGQYVTLNQNFAVQRLLASLQPHRSLTLSLLYYHYRVENDSTSLASPWTTHPGDVEAGSFGNEVDLVVDFAPNAHLGISGVLAIFAPTQGGEAFFGNGDTWLGFMLYATLKF